MYRCSKLLALSAMLGLPAMALAQTTSSAPITQAQYDSLQQAVRAAQASGDNAWMLISAALVLLMTAPGLTLFYGGLVRRKNILGTMMQSFAMMGLITVLWAVVGYSLPLEPATASSAASSTPSCAASRSRPIPTTAAPSPSRPSWSIN